MSSRKIADNVKTVPILLLIIFIIKQYNNIIIYIYNNIDSLLISDIDNRIVQLFTKNITSCKLETRSIACDIC